MVRRQAALGIRLGKTGSWNGSKVESQHCSRARKLTDEQRSSVASYLSIYRGSESDAAKLALSQVSASNHPSVDRALRLLTAAWTEVMPMPRQMVV